MNDHRRDEPDLARRALREHLGWTDDRTSEAGETADPGHLPAAMIAGGRRRLEEIAGVEGELVRQHLENCPLCQADVAFMEELSPGVSGRAREVSAVRVADERPRASGSRINSWLGGGLMGAAVASVILWVALPRQPLPHPESGIVEWVSPSFTRGGISGTRERPASGEPLVLLLPVPDATELAPARVTIVDPKGRRLFDGEIGGESVSAGTALLQLSAPQEGWLAGTYRVRIEVVDRREEGRFVLVDPR